MIRSRSTKQEKLDEMTRLYGLAMQKLSNWYYKLSEEDRKHAHPVIERAIRYRREADETVEKVLDGRADIEDFKDAVRVWYKALSRAMRSIGGGKEKNDAEQD